jgi:hypothetical protein
MQYTTDMFALQTETREIKKILAIPRSVDRFPVTRQLGVGKAEFARLSLLEVDNPFFLTLFRSRPLGILLGIYWL